MGWGQLAFLLVLLDLLHELLEVDGEHLEEVLLVLLVLAETELEGVLALLALLHLVEVGEGVDPLELGAALDSELVGGLHELRLGQVQLQRPEEVLALGEHVDVAVVVGHLLVEQVPLRAVVHPLQDLLLLVDLLLGALLVDVALEVVLVVGLPRLRAHVAEVLPAGARDEVAAHRPLYCFLAEGADLGVLADPLHVRLLLDHLLDPLLLLVAVAGVVVVALAAEAEHLPAHALHRLQLQRVHLYAVVAVQPRAELVVLVGRDEHLAQLLLVPLQPLPPLCPVVPQNSLHALQQQRGGAVRVHAGDVGAPLVDAALDVPEPALYTKLVAAYVGAQHDVFLTAHHAHADIVLDVAGLVEVGTEAHLLQVLLVLVVVLLLEVLLVPLEQSQQAQAPPQVEVDHVVDLPQDVHQLLEDALERQYLEGLHLNNLALYPLLVLLLAVAAVVVLAGHLHLHLLPLALVVVVVVALPVVLLVVVVLVVVHYQCYYMISTLRKRHIVQHWPLKLSRLSHIQLSCNIHFIMQQRVSRSRIEDSTSLCDTKYKIVLLGNMGVGKTSIIDRFVREQFDHSNTPTVGIDFISRTITLANKTYRLQLWDTAGQEKYKSLIPTYLRDSNAAIFVYDVKRPQSLQDIRGWLELYRQNQSQKAIASLVGNKIDLLEGENPLKEDAVNMAKQENLVYSEVSAKDGTGVSDLFLGLTYSLSIEPSQPEEEAVEDKEAEKVVVKLGQATSRQQGCCSI